MADAEYDPSTPLGLVRLLIPDKVQVPNTYTDNGVTYILSDDDIEALLALNSQNVRMAAADACELIGTDELLIGKVIITDDLATDASKVAQQMFGRAKALRDTVAKLGGIDTGQDDMVITDLAPSHTGWPYGLNGGPELVDQVPFPYSGF